MKDTVNTNKRLMEMVTLQESVIEDLTREVTKMKGGDGGPDVGEALIKELSEARSTIKEMEAMLRRPQDTAVVNPPSSASAGTPAVKVDPAAAHRTALQESCDKKFGRGLLDSWFSSPKVVCDGGSSKVVCYTHKHPWRDDVQSFCVGDNIEVDFGKIKGVHAVDKKPARGRGMYLNFEGGAFGGDCEKTAEWGNVRFMPHADLALRTFEAGRSVGGGRVEGSATYLLARDEDSENAFHSTSDFINMHMVMEGMGIDRANVLLFDLMPDGPFKEMIDVAFSKGGKSKRKEEYGEDKVTFRKLIFHLESPAGIIFPKIGVVGGKKQLDCRDSYLWHGYRERVLRAFQLWDVPPPRVPSITLVVRRRTPSKNVGRILSNEAEVTAVIKECQLCTHQVLDLATLTYREQLEAVRGTSVLVGVHGAGLMNVLFAAEEAVLIEVHPHYRMDRHFRVASRMSGKFYMPMRTRERVTCQGSSDNVKVDVEEFRRVLDGAVRMARSFDDGISECGLKCPGGILALDNGRDEMYSKLGVNKESRPDTRFPCG
ncbi:hypothetical protein TrCOL_g12197 [Triparma columacea]|uniref:EGF domain-specific O-linked N-acetylglucosamine transferase n=1 Tax=Triparma columacea TaxID=722753 RepID=A0A9W7GFW7_9STRA|nr:hypothetical protein TrCOL_g12197 [Triparma columacea]